MKVTASAIKAKIKDLPENVREHVTRDPENKSLAYVKSFSTDKTYTVHIEIHKDDPGDKSILNSMCPCDARTLCKHVTAFYAVSKGIGPLIDGDMPAGVPESKSKEETGQIPVKEPSGDLTALTMTMINAFGEWANALARRMK